MAEEMMPAADVQEEGGDERALYECAYHILPTVAEEEVARVVAALEGFITSHGGEIAESEAPQRFNLAYEIRKMTEGRAYRYTTSYFGWTRFSLAPASLAQVVEEISHQGEILRHLIIRLTREEEAKPFRVFEKKQEPATVVLSEADADTKGEVSEADLNKSLEEITS
jgi:ribosomal protein S6